MQIKQNHSLRKAIIFADEGYSQVNIFNVVFNERHDELDLEPLIRERYAARVAAGVANASGCGESLGALAAVADAETSSVAASASGTVPVPKAKAKAKGKGKSKAVAKTKAAGKRRAGR